MPRGQKEKDHNPLPGPLHITSVARELRNGAASTIQAKAKAGAGVRVTEQAAIDAGKQLERYLAGLGTECAKILNLKGAKTVNKNVLLYCIAQDQCRFSGARAAIEGSSAPDKRKVSKDAPARAGQKAPKGHGDRQSIAVASAVKAFGLNIATGKSGYRVSGDSKYALSSLARAYLNALGAGAGRFANAGGRATVKASDVASAVGCL